MGVALPPDDDVELAVPVEERHVAGIAVGVAVFDAVGEHGTIQPLYGAASGCTAPVTVRDCACTDKSYPRFWTDLSALKTVPAAENTELE